MTSRKNSKGSLVPVKIIPPTRSAYTYPLLIKHLLHSPMTRAPDQEIVYRDLRRRTYREFRERIGRLASGLAEIGVDQGDVVAILEWDSDRYHECYFAIPMMGAVMQTVNVSLVPEDIAYTIIDSGATTVLFNADFLPLVEKLAPHLKAVKSYVLMHDRPERAEDQLSYQGRIRGAAVDRFALLPVPGLRRERRSPPSSTRREQPVGRRASISAIGRWCCTRSPASSNMALRLATAASIATTFTCR